MERLIGLQAQAPNLPYVGLWSRLAGFQPESVSRMVEAREAVRLSLMRNTIHLVTASDAFALKPVFGPLAERGLFRGSPWGRGMTRESLAPVLAQARRLMHERPRTVAELGRELAARFPSRDATALAYCARYLLPLVFVPPRGTWGGRGPVALTTFQAWLGREPGPAASAESLVLRYLRAFGPASVADMRAWSGLTFREAFERLRPTLEVFRDENGVELFDVRDGPRPPGATPVPVRLLPDYDNILLGHADRTRIMAPGQHLGLFSSNGIMKGSVLLDGFVRAAWRPEESTGGATIAITPFGAAIGRRERPAIAEEALALLGLLAPGRRHHVRFGAAEGGVS